MAEKIPIHKKKIPIKKKEEKIPIHKKKIPIKKKEVKIPVVLKQEAKIPIGLKKSEKIPIGLKREAKIPIGLKREEKIPIGLKKVKDPRPKLAPYMDKIRPIRIREDEVLKYEKRGYKVMMETKVAPMVHIKEYRTKKGKLVKAHDRGGNIQTTRYTAIVCDDSKAMPYPLFGRGPRVEEMKADLIRRGYRV